MPTFNPLSQQQQQTQSMFQDTSINICISINNIIGNLQTFHLDNTLITLCLSHDDLWQQLHSLIFVKCTKPIPPTTYPHRKNIWWRPSHKHTKTTIETTPNTSI